MVGVNLLNGSELPRMLYRCDVAAGNCVSETMPIQWAESRVETVALKHLHAAMRSGHLSVLEHCVLCFEITDISRVASHQLVRHRLMSIEQQSLRYTTADKDWFIPEKVLGTEWEERFIDLANQCWLMYRDMTRDGIPEEDARYILPMCTTSNIVVTMNLREFMHFCGLRRCARTQTELREIADLMAQRVVEFVPWLGPWLGPQCEMLGYCPERVCCGNRPRASMLVDTPHQSEEMPQVRLYPVGNGGVDWVI